LVSYFWQVFSFSIFPPKLGAIKKILKYKAIIFGFWGGGSTYFVEPGLYSIESLKSLEDGLGHAGKLSIARQHQTV